VSLFDKIRGLFGGSKFVRDYRVVSLYHPATDRFVALLEQSRWSEFESNFKKFPIGDRHFLLGGIAMKFCDPTMMNQWIASGSSIAKVAKGIYQTEQAWLARSSDRAENVSQQQFAEFHALLKEATASLRSAHQLAPTDPEAASRLITVMMGLEAPKKQYYELFRRTGPDETPHLGAAFTMVDALSGKWHGSSQEALAFARTMAPRSEVFLSLIPLAHIEAWIYLGHFDNDQGAAELEVIGNRGFNKPWDYLNMNTTQAINEARQRVGLARLKN